jgi:hypothetical protein
MGVINLAHIQTIFSMCHKGFCFLKCFKKLQAIHKENRNLLLGASEKYIFVQCFCFSSGLENYKIYTMKMEAKSFEWKIIKLCT